MRPSRMTVTGPDRRRRVPVSWGSAEPTRSAARQSWDPTGVSSAASRGGEDPWLCDPGFRRVCLCWGRYVDLRSGTGSVKHATALHLAAHTGPLWLRTVLATSGDADHLMSGAARSRLCSAPRVALQSFAHRSGDFSPLHRCFPELRLHLAGNELVIGERADYEHTVRRQVLGQPIGSLQTSSDLSHPTVNDTPESPEVPIIARREGP
jgi:hypothetical protein